MSARRGVTPLQQPAALSARGARYLGKNPVSPKGMSDIRQQRATWTNRCHGATAGQTVDTHRDWH